MKNIDKDIDPKDIHEEHTDYNISIEEYNSEDAYLEFPEELDTKVVSYIEREVRNSYEYRAYISYLKNELDLTKCSLLPGIDINECKVSLEFHHYPMNLFEIAQTVGTQMIMNCNKGEKISCFDISQKVVEEHYKNNIGLIPLTKTLHDMAHNQAIIIPISKVHGNYKNFVTKYSDYISEDIKDRIMQAELNSESDDSKAYNAAKLEKNISRYDITYINKDSETTMEDNKDE